MKKQKGEYSPSGKRIHFLEESAKEKNLPFALSVVESIKHSPDVMSLQQLADLIGMNKDTMVRRLNGAGDDTLYVNMVLSIARVLHLDPVTSLNQFFFDSQQWHLAEHLYFGFNVQYGQMNEQDMSQVYSVIDRFLSLPDADRQLFLGMLDAFQARQQATPPQESGLSDTPSEE